MNIPSMVNRRSVYERSLYTHLEALFREFKSGSTAKMIPNYDQNKKLEIWASNMHGGIQMYINEAFPGTIYKSFYFHYGM